MKKIYNKFLIFAIALTLVVSSCSEDYLDINISPNNPSPNQVIPLVIVPNVEIGIGFLVGQTIQLYTTNWMQHSSGTGTQTTPYDIYQLTNGDGDGAWNSIYAGFIPDLANAKSKARAQRDTINVGIIQVMEAYSYVIAADLFGDVPMSEANQFPAIKTPKYDPQQQVYTNALLTLDSAIFSMSRRNNGGSIGDLIYAGSAANWTRAANSIKLKIFMQLRQKDPATAIAGINALIAGNNFIATNAQNFQLVFSTTSRAQNPFYQYNHIGRPNDLAISPNIFGVMTANADPRIPAYFTTTGVNYVTYPNGLNQTVLPTFTNNRSRWGTYLSGTGGTLIGTGALSRAGASPTRFITASMVRFWIAEAALTLTGINAVAATEFTNAMTLNFAEVSTVSGLTLVSAPYITARNTAFTVAANSNVRLSVVMNEKWLTTVGTSYETYNDWRRTGLPLLPLAQNAVLSGIPFRFPYPQNELNTNNANVPLKNSTTDLSVKPWFMN